MKIQVVSDLHLSRAPCVVPDVGADLLVLAGDIHRPAQAISWARALDRSVIYVAGDHEYYQSSLVATDRLLQELSRGSRVTVLNCAEQHVGNVRVLGATLWSDFRLHGDGPARDLAMQEAARSSRDFSRIRVQDDGAVFSPAHCVQLFQQHVAWLQAVLAEPFAGETVVVTHFAPSSGSIAARFAGSPLNPFFVSSLEALIEKSGAALWVHGHTHDSFDYRIGATRVLCNPRGYVVDGQAENRSFEPGLTVDLG